MRGDITGSQSGRNIKLTIYFHLIRSWESRSFASSPSVSMGGDSAPGGSFTLVTSAATKSLQRIVSHWTDLNNAQSPEDFWRAAAGRQVDGNGQGRSVEKGRGYISLLIASGWPDRSAFKFTFLSLASKLEFWIPHTRFYSWVYVTVILLSKGTFLTFL